MKKVFLFTQKSYTNSRMCGHKVTAQVYEVIKNIPKHVGEVQWNTASFKGETSAIMNFLAKEGKLPKKFEGGYYKSDMKFSIIEL